MVTVDGELLVQSALGSLGDLLTAGEARCSCREKES